MISSEALSKYDDFVDLDWIDACADEYRQELEMFTRETAATIASEVAEYRRSILLEALCEAAREGASLQ